MTTFKTINTLKTIPMSYCSFCKDLPADNVHKIYHDYHYGVRIENDDELFGRLILEINQAGLSWDLMLKKQENFRTAFAGFNISSVAGFGDAERTQLLNNEGIIRNKLKIDAVIHNARVLPDIQASHGSFLAWLDQHHPLSKPDWVKLFKKTFKFTGGEIVGEFLMSTGFLAGAHSPDCPKYRQIT